MDALSSAVPLNADVDLQVKLKATGLYRLLATCTGRGRDNSRARTLFRKFDDTVANVEIAGERIVVSFGHRAISPGPDQGGIRRQGATDSPARQHALAPSSWLVAPNPGPLHIDSLYWNQ